MSNLNCFANNFSAKLIIKNKGKERVFNFIQGSIEQIFNNNYNHAISIVMSGEGYWEDYEQNNNETNTQNNNSDKHDLFRFKQIDLE